MHKANPSHRRRNTLGVLLVLAAATIPLALTGSTPAPRMAATEIDLPGTALQPEAVAEVNMTQLAQQARLFPPGGPVQPLMFNELEEPEEPTSPAPGYAVRPAGPEPLRVQSPQIVSPAPSLSYAGLDDIAMADTGFIIIPPDVNGAVGPNKVLEFLNNNLRIRDKQTGATQLTVGTTTFWNPVLTPTERFTLTDPKTVYDPYNCCFIAVMQTTGTNAAVLVAVSQTSDPAGAWWLYKFTGLSGTLGGNYLLDFPCLGFNKNWVEVTIGRFTTAGAFSYDVALVLNYPQLRVGVGSGTLFTLNVGAATTHFCTAPAYTYSATEDTLFNVIHFSSGGATFAVDRVTGTPAAPVYTAAGALNVRPGGGWTQPSGQQFPQSAPNAGVSVCAPPCPIETQDAQVRSAPTYRLDSTTGSGYLYYTQTIRLTAPVARNLVQWTKITPSTTPDFADGGRIDDVTATLWYGFPHIAVNAQGDFILGYSQFGSGQHPSAGYSYHFASDGLGTIRDPFIYKPGEDYYHKTFGGTRNRWGDFSTCAVDPCDDQTLWTLQEYGKNRTGTDDGNSGANSSKWGTYWAAVAGPAPALVVSCLGDTIAPPGSNFSRDLKFQNTGSAAGTYSYTVSDNAGWVTPQSGTTPIVGPSSFFDIFVQVNVPPDCNPPSDLVTITVQPNGNCPNCYAPQTCQYRVVCDNATATLVSRFEAVAARSGVDLSWASDATGQVRGWNVYRATNPAGAWGRINSDPIAMGAGGEFRLHDSDATSGELFYRLAALSPGGSEDIVSSANLVLGGQAISFAFAGRSPFTEQTTLRYSLPRAEHVQISVYSVEGRLVRTLVNGNEAAGEHTVEFSLQDGGRSMAPGVYLVRIDAGKDRKTLRLVGLKK